MANTVTSGPITFLDDVVITTGSIEPTAISDTFELDLVTTNATPTVAVYMSDVTAGLIEDSVITVTGRMNGLNTTYLAHSCGGTFEAVYYFDFSEGTSLLIGTPTVTVKSDSSASFTLTNTGISVTGIAGITFNWHPVYSVLIN